MSVDPATSTLRHDHGGITYWFCNPKCQAKFVAEPERYLRGDGAAHGASSHGGGAAAAGDPNAIYTCPMHPEVRQKGPGACPLCGMALEPVTADVADEGPSAELRDMTRRFWVSLALTLPVLGIAMGEMFAPALFGGFGSTPSLWA